MIPRETIATARIPGGEELCLVRHGADFMITVARNELMSTRMRGSEEALATMSCAHIAACAKPQMLIGGYGMGFTLRTALRALSADANITVAEIVPEIIAWARGPMRRLTDGCLDDGRVTLVIDDVGMLIHSATSGYDAILLDVDNGPEGLTRRRNDNLYSPAGLRAAKSALRAGGILAVWSSSADAAFTRKLSQAGFTVSEVGVSAHTDEEGLNHHIWFARKP